MTVWRIADRLTAFAQGPEKSLSIKLSDFATKYAYLPLTAAAAKAQNTFDAEFRASNLCTARLALRLITFQFRRLV
jgi:hypothetical protein